MRCGIGSDRIGRSLDFIYVPNRWRMSELQGRASTSERVETAIERDGKIGEPALFDVEGERPSKAIAKLRLKSVKRAATDMLWIRYAVRKARS